MALYIICRGFFFRTGWGMGEVKSKREEPLFVVFRLTPVFFYLFRAFFSSFPPLKEPLRRTEDCCR